MGAFGFNRDEKQSKKERNRQDKLQRKAEKRQWARDRKVRRESFDRAVSLGVIVLIILIVAAVASKLQNNDIPTFSSFLSYLKTAPTISLDWAVIPQVSFDSKYFEWAETTINIITSIINFFGFVSKCATNATIYILWMLYFFIY